MLTIVFRFPAGRYHATPWGRHVNEAALDWPPSPWRLLRALVAVWHRKADQERFPEELLASLLERLGERLPLYSLPFAIHSHARHYMPSPEKKTLVFDAFARLSPDDFLLVFWPAVDLPGKEKELLAHLLERLGYLGRAESWVEASLCDREPDSGEYNCAPAEERERIRSVGDAVPIELIAPLSQEEFQRQRERWRNDPLEGVSKRDKAKILATLEGDRLIDALRLDTSDLQAAGWSLPLGARKVVYLRPEIGPLPRRRTLRAESAPRPARKEAARFALAGKPLPRIEDAVRIGELVRAALTGQAKRITGEENIPPLLSGHGETDPRHSHAFFLPEDADGDGWIDHFIVCAPRGFDPESRRALARLEKLYQREEGEWRVALEGIFPADDFQDSLLLGKSVVWRSVTPYLHPWFAKKGFWPADQIRRECEKRHLPVPVDVVPEEVIPVRGRRLRPIHFHRFRSKRGLAQPDRRGSFWRLVFPEPVTGPLALGFGCHFGLGLFAREKDAAM